MATANALNNISAPFTVSSGDLTVTSGSAKAGTFDTVTAAAHVTLSGTTLAAVGSDADINISITPKGTGSVVISKVSLTTDLTVGDGGTGASTFTQYGVLLGNAANAIQVTAAGTTGQILRATSGANPGWTTATYPATFNKGDVLCATAANVVGVRASGTSGQLMTAVTSDIPAWTTATYPATTAQGDLLSSTSANTVVALAKNTTATRYLANTGASNNAAWDQVNLANGITGTLVVGNGGTGAATFTQYGVMLGNAANALQVTAAGATGTVLIGTTGANPSFSATPTVTTMNATTFDTNVAAAGVTLAGTTLAADGSDANIGISITPKGTGVTTCSTGITSTAGNITATSGNFVATAGNLLLPTTSSTIGQVQINSVRFAHSYGTSNTFIGAAAGNFTTSGTGLNVAVGAAALDALTTGSSNIAIGKDAAGALTEGNYNVLIGTEAGAAITTGVQVVAIGYQALDAVTTGNICSVGIGHNALGALNGAGVSCTAVGNRALEDCTTGTDNVAVGDSAAKNITTSSGITAIGSNALLTATTATGNTAIGFEALKVITGNNNVALGYQAMANQTTGGNSIAIGYQAMLGAASSTATLNIVIGYGAGEVVTSANRNVLIGGSAGDTLTTGAYNTIIGYVAGSGSITTGSYNVFIGEATGSSYASDESSNIVIGSAIAGTAGEDNVLRIGDGTGTGNGQLASAYISGIFGKAVDGATDVPVIIDSANKLGTTTSSARYKENIADMASASDCLMSLRPVIFNYKTDEQKRTRFGLIAEEVIEIFPELVVKNSDGEPEAVKYHEMPTILLNEIQKLNKRIEILEAQILAGRLQ